jgi:hypothetical protein
LIVLVENITNVVIAVEGEYSVEGDFFLKDNTMYQRDMFYEIEYDGEIPENFEIGDFKIEEGVVKKSYPKYINLFEFTEMIGGEEVLAPIIQASKTDLKIETLKFVLESNKEQINIQRKEFNLGMMYLKSLGLITQEVYSENFGLVELEI